VVLAALSILGGLVGIPAALGGSNRFEHFLGPVMSHPGVREPVETVVLTPGAGGVEHEAAAHRGTREYALMAASVLIALAGIWLARLLYLKRSELPARLASSWGGLYRLVYRKYYMDEAYDALFVNRAMDLGTTLAAFDSNVIDGLGVDGAGWLTRFTSRVSIWWDTWIVDGLVNLTARVVWLFSYPVRMAQTGLVSSYSLLIVVGVLLFLGYYLRTMMH
jgi:NADH-quinone oxidoreductase subunit L